MKSLAIVLVLLVLPGCFSGVVKYQTPPVVTEVRVERGRLLVEKCVLETGEATELSFTKIDCKVTTTELGK